MLIGARDDVPDVLDAIDVAVTCSDFEGTPLSVLEYMEAGLPVVASRVGGLPDLIEDGVHGLLVPRRDPTTLAQALHALLRDPERRRAMGEAGRQRRREQFDFDVMVGRLEDLYERLYAGRRGRRTAARPARR
jgi:L-malate glycosyltransferase